jgi:MFS family permease
VYLQWWVQEQHLSPAIVAVMLAAGDLAITALEVPTGWLADRYGHRACLIAGSALQVAGLLCSWFGRGVPGLLLASLLIALGDAFRSGADQALLSRSCVALDREADFQRIEAQTRALTLVALVVLLVAGGVLVDFRGFAAGWLLETILSATGLAIAIAMVEPPAALDASTPTRNEPASVERRTSGFALAALIIPASCLGGIAGAMAFYAQTSWWATVERATTLVALVTLAEAAGAAMARRASASLRSQIVLAGAGLVLLGAARVDSAAFIFATIALSFLLGLAEPLRATAIQRIAGDDMRARAASIASACDKTVSTVALVIAGRR